MVPVSASLSSSKSIGSFRAITTWCERDGGDARIFVDVLIAGPFSDGKPDCCVFVEAFLADGLSSFACGFVFCVDPGIYVKQLPFIIKAQNDSSNN